MPASKPRRKKYLTRGPRRPNKNAQGGPDTDDTPETRVTASYLQHDCGAVPLEFGSPDEGCFNPYRVKPAHPRAVLTTSLLRKVDYYRRDFWTDIPCCLDDQQLEEQLSEPDSGIQQILRSASAMLTLQDLLKEISSKVQRNERQKQLLGLVESCVFRMDQYKNPVGNQVHPIAHPPPSLGVSHFHLDRHS